MADPSIGGGRDVWASTAMLEATRAERARHAASCRDAAGAIAAAAARRGLAPMAPLGRVAALRAALTRLGLDDGELASEETLAAALGDWALQHADRNVADDGPPTTRHGGPPQHGPEPRVDQRIAFFKRAPRRDDALKLRRQRRRRKAHDAVDAALDATHLCGNQISGAPRHRRDFVLVTASAQ